MKNDMINVYNKCHIRECTNLLLRAVQHCCVIWGRNGKVSNSQQHNYNFYKLASLGHPRGMSGEPMLSRGGNKVANGCARSRCWLRTLSITHEADSLASASWSQHSSIVSQRADRPWNIKIKTNLRPQVIKCKTI